LDQAVETAVIPGVVCFAGSAPGPAPAGVSLFLRAQKKVTKKEGLNTSHLVVTLRP
jgi:hypothetical protein